MTVVTSNICLFHSSKPFVVNTTFSTVLVGVEASSVSWLGQLTVGDWITDYSNYWVSKFCCCFVLEFKSHMRGDVCMLCHFVLRWHHWAGFRRRPLLVFRSLQVKLNLFYHGDNITKMNNFDKWKLMRSGEILYTAFWWVTPVVPFCKNVPD